MNDDAAVIRFIRDNPYPVRISWIAVATGLSTSQVHAALDSAVQAGHVKRASSNLWMAGDTSDDEVEAAQQEAFDRKIRAALYHREEDAGPRR